MFPFASCVPVLWRNFHSVFSFILYISFQQQKNKPAVLPLKIKKTGFQSLMMFVLALEEGNFLFRQLVWGWFFAFLETSFSFPKHLPCVLLWLLVREMVLFNYSTPQGCFLQRGDGISGFPGLTLKISFMSLKNNIWLKEQKFAIK